MVSKALPGDNGERGKVYRLEDRGRSVILSPTAVVADIVEDLGRWKLVLPDELRGEALRESHDDPQAGHLSVEKTYHRLVTAYYWPGMFRPLNIPVNVGR